MCKSGCFGRTRTCKVEPVDQSLLHSAVPCLQCWRLWVHGCSGCRSMLCVCLPSRMPATVACCRQRSCTVRCWPTWTPKTDGLTTMQRCFLPLRAMCVQCHHLLHALLQHRQGRVCETECRHSCRRQCLMVSVPKLQELTHAPLIRCSQLSLDCHAQVCSWPLAIPVESWCGSCRLCMGSIVRGVVQSQNALSASVEDIHLMCRRVWRCIVFRGCVICGFS
jgi:hypothetical protein